MSQKLPVNKFEWIEENFQFNKDFMKNCNKESNQKPHELHNDLPFLPEWIKLEKVKKLVAHLKNKTECVIHIRNLKQVLNHGLILKKVYTVIKFNQKEWLKPYIDMNTKLRQKAKSWWIAFSINFIKFQVFEFLEKLWKMLENIEILNFLQQKGEKLI